MYGLVLLLSIYPLSGYGRLITYDEKTLSVAWDEMYQLSSYEKESSITKDKKKQEYTSMEALDLVKKSYASNFERIMLTEKEYYYKLNLADYYLVYEGQGETEQQYIFHLYEYVQDEPELGIGHTVTYGWYQVDKITGKILEVQ